MELTITQNGALYAMQHRGLTKYHGPLKKRATPDQLKIFPTLRTPMGEFALRLIPAGKGPSTQREVEQIADSFPEYRAAA